MITAYGLSLYRQCGVFHTLNAAKDAVLVAHPIAKYFQRFPSDPIGAFVVTLTNVVVGSRVHVEKQDDGTSFYDGVATSSTVSVSLSAYGTGSAYNDLRIKVRKGSATTYKPWETLATAIVGSQSIYVSQIPDE